VSLSCSCILCLNLALQVGGVSFNAFTPQTLKILQDNHRLVRVRGIRRREAMAHWGHIGSMTGVGSRMPNGGRKGDGYAPYACHRGDTPDDIKAVMRHGLVSLLSL
jgi:hypothetical protein